MAHQHEHGRSDIPEPFAVMPVEDYWAARHGEDRQLPSNDTFDTPHPETGGDMAGGLEGYLARHEYDPYELMPYGYNWKKSIKAQAEAELPDATETALDLTRHEPSQYPLGASNDLTHNNTLRKELGGSFSVDDELGTRGKAYDRVRPTYPREAVQAILDFAGNSPDLTILEIGCGTGIGTRALAETGLPITAIDPSQSFLDVARESLGSYDNVELEVAKLEEYDIQPGSVDVAVGFQSYHWIDPEKRWPLTYNALRDGGTVAIASNFPDEYSSNREQAVRELYLEHCPSFPNREWGTLMYMADHQRESGLFEDQTVLSFRHRQTYTREEYITWQHSLSWVGTLPEEKRAAFTADVEAVIGEADQVVMPWRTEVMLARKPVADTGSTEERPVDYGQWPGPQVPDMSGIISIINEKILPDGTSYAVQANMHTGELQLRRDGATAAYPYDFVTEVGGGSFMSGAYILSEKFEQMDASDLRPGRQVPFLSISHNPGNDMENGS